MKQLQTLCVSMLILAVPMLTGCATSGLTGTTKLKAKYDSNVLADGSDHTIVDMEASGKAGDVLQAVTNASVSAKDGSGSERIMSFGGEQANDGTRRADSIDAMNAAWSQAFIQMNQSWMQMLGVVADVLGGVKLGEQAADTAQTQARADALVKAVKAVVPKQPKPAVPLEPVEPLEAVEPTP